MAVNMTFVYVFVLTEISQHMAVNMTFVYVFVLTEIRQHMAVNITFVYVFVLTEIRVRVCTHRDPSNMAHDLCTCLYSQRSVNIWQ